VLGIRLIHASPRAATTKGKIERFLCATRRFVASPAQVGGNSKGGSWV
jgi:hypothetical protein